MKTSYILLFLAFIIGIIIIVSLIVFKPDNNQSSLTTPPNPQPIKIEQIPFTQNIGTDLNSPLVTNSQAEVAKLKSFLPFSQTLTLSSGAKVNVLIPTQQDNPWTLTVQISDINYEIPPDDPDYVYEKAAFVDATNQLFSWIRSKGAKPNNIVFIWGNKSFIQERAEKWLSEP
jgi:hypothetical protein